MVKPTKLQTFQALVAKAKKTRDSSDIREAMRFGIENRISTAKIRSALR